jgi:uncharacterized UPF0160 family protein
MSDEKVMGEEKVIGEKPVLKLGVTHSGVFHADDVFATALLKILYPGINIMRLSEVPDKFTSSPNVIIYDIGRGRYDHHGSAAEYRSNGIEYSSFGKLWRDFGIYLLPSQFSRNYVDSVLVQEIDRTDNGMGSNPLSLAIKWLNITWNDNPKREQEQFDKAVSFAYEILDNLIRRKLSEEEADRVIEKAYETQRNNVLVLKTYVPISPNIRDNIYFVIYPSNRGGFNINTVTDRTCKNGTWYRKAFPNSWRTNPPEGLDFMHDKFAHFDTIDHAIVAANTALNYTEVKPNILALIKDHNWIVSDDQALDSTDVELEAVDVLDNGDVCPSYPKSDFYSLNPIEYVDGKLLISSKKSYGTIICSIEKHIHSVADAVKFNETSPVKIIMRAFKDGSTNTIYTNDDE